MDLRKNFPLIIISAFLLVWILQCFPTCLAARYLADGPQPDQSKSDVQGSQIGRDGSANGQSAPTNGVVQRPPTSFYKSISSTQRNSSKTVTTSHNGVKNSTTTTSHDEHNQTDWNGKKSETGSSSVNVTTNGNGGGGGQVSSPTPNAVYEPPPFNFPPFPPFP
ncbi:hypothetical protein LWI28_011793 [Acer negundo]|uniref:Uncharacterized protein n=1 Tax=Acer negundo TaxID=4023 RepID=A0AAD5NN66_ACENE|nr:hypothetical protein LWI28_011793 [Acer negundo]KAK4841491.1 hypothetical protein QYF36_005393 [Acer negundo]